VFFSIWIRRLAERGSFANRTVIVGVGEQGRRIADYLRETADVRIRVLGLIDTLDEAFRDHAPPYQLVSRGAFFAYLRHPFEGRSSIEVAKDLARNQGLLVLPGEFFGASQGDYLRVAFANASAEQLEDLARRLAMNAPI
jgi:aspartate/methionine/tyrosine aminotransferase